MGAEDLAQAAHAAVVGVRALRERLDDAQERCDESARRIDTLTHAIESDRKALHEAVEELDTSVAEASKKLFDDAAAAESGLADVTNASHEAGIEGLQALEVESTALDGAAQHVQDVGPRIAALADAAEAASRAALERAAAIADDLRQLVDEAERLLGTELAAALAEMMEEAEKAAADVRDVLEKQGPELLLQAEVDFGAKMSEAEDLVNRVLPDMENHADEVAGYCVEELEQLADHEMDDIEAESRTQEGELENLTALAAEKTAEIEQAGASLVNAMQENGSGAQAAEKALEEIRARWMTFGFAL